MFGLLNTGFSKKDLQTIKSEIETDFKNVFGSNIDVSESSNFGQIIGLLSKKVANQWDLAETIYNVFNPANAEGQQLDNVLAMVGVFRGSASSTTVDAIMRGSNGTLVPSGSIAEKEETGEQFSLDSNTTIDKSTAIEVTFEITNVIDSTVYTITIDAVPYTYNSGVGATAESIMAGLKASFELGSDPITFTDNLDGTCVLLADDVITAFSFLEDANMTVNEVGVNGDFTAIVPGTTSLPANTLNVIATPVSGLDSINNFSAGNTGEDIETDEEFRQRARTAQQALGGGSDEAIRGRVLSLDNVTSATVTSNRTNSVDGDGRPAKSFETVAQGGDDDEIALTIWNYQPSGIESFGNTTVVVQDSQNNNQTIKFSRPEIQYIWVEVDITLYSEETFPTNGTDAIKEAIVDFSLNEYSIGTDVLIQRLNTPIFSISGIASATIGITSTLNPLGPPGAYGTSDITIDSRQLAEFDTARITVGIV